MGKINRLFYIALTLLVALPAVAQTVPAELTDPEPVIEAVQDSEVVDRDIQTRIDSIFAELETLGGVKVAVNQGVVRLTGETANEAAALQAQRLAIRLAGVVTVEDQINRTLDVRDNVEPVLNRFWVNTANLIKALPLIALAFTVVIFFTFLGGFLAKRTSLWQRVAPNSFLAHMLSQAVRFAIFVIGVVIALNLLGASAIISTILGGAGVVGLAIGFAVRDSMENYISSIMLSLRQPFRAQDHVVINEHEGIVVRLTSRATILMTLEGNHLRIPNSVVFKGIILNYTTNPERRFSFELGMDAADDPVAAMKTGLDAIRALEFVMSDPEPGAVIVTVGDSNIVIKFSAWIDQTTTNYGKARSLSIRAAMKVLEENGFTMPEPIYRLRFDPDFNAALGVGVGGLRSQAQKATKSLAEPREPINPGVELDEETLDVSPDTHLAEKVAEEIRSDSGSDLLDEERPTE